MAHGQTLPPAAEAYHRTQQLETLAASAAASRQWRRLDFRDIDRSWATVGPVLFAVLTTGQRRVSGRAPGYMSTVLAQTGQSRWDDPFGTAVPFSLVGVAGDGRPVGTLLELAPIQLKELIRDGVPPQIAWSDVNTWLETVTENVVADTARAAEKVEMAIRPIDSYIRIVNAGACSRCAILAGREYRMSVAFARHDRCRCEHIPVGQAGEFEQWQFDSTEYFNSLSKEEQNRIFTAAGAEAIRAGADINQVVNARRGMSTAQKNTTRGWVPQGRLAPVQVHGRWVYTTTEGTTRHGIASGPLTRRSGRQATRLMPETLVPMAGGNRTELRRLLRAHGYIR